MSIKKAQSGTVLFPCKACKYSFSRRCDLVRHYTTVKHLLAVKVYKPVVKNDGIDRPYICEPCGRSYCRRSGLCKHRKTCTEINHMQMVVNPEPANKDVEIDYKAIISDQMKIIQDQQELLADAVPKIGNNNRTVNNIDNTVNNVSINLFLNTECQNAMTIDDFLSQLKLGMSELTRTGEQGFVAGMIDIFKDSLGKLETTERPIHCTDTKRCTMYVKNDEGWAKDVDEAETRRLVKAVKKKNCVNLAEWAEKHPGATEGEDPHGDEYVNLVTEATGGDYEEVPSDHVGKIMKGFAHEVKVDLKRTAVGPG